MKVLSTMKKMLLSLFVLIFSVCCFGLIAVNNDTVDAKAETTSSVSMKWVVSSATTTLDYVYIYFDGFNTKVNYDEPAADDYVFRNVYINGTSIHDINKNTDTSSWSWDIFPQTEMASYRKPVISYIGGTASSNKYIEIRIHKNFTAAMTERDGYFMITVANGFTVNGYTIDKETSYSLRDGELKDAASVPTIDWRGSYDGSSTMDYMYVSFKGFTTKDDYEGNANSDYVFKNIMLNGISLYEINNTMDVTGWVWDTFPQNEASLPQYKKPVIGYIKDTNGRIQLRLHKNLTNALLVEDGYVVLSVCQGFTLNGYRVAEEVAFELMYVDDAAPITVDTWNMYPGASHLYYAYVHFEGFNVKDDYSGSAVSEDVLKSILLNGTSIYDINKNTSVSGWTWEIFPQTADAKYQKPVLTYVNGTGKIELRIHKNLYDSIIAEYGALEISVNEGLMLNGYINREPFKAVKNSSDVFVEPTVIDASTVTTSRWQPLSHKKLTYFDIKYAGFPQLDYQVMDVAKYYYIENMIAINGVKMSDINKNTDTSGWEWLQFPSTAAAIYQKPFVTLVNSGSMEVRMHDNYWATIKEDGLKITVLPGYYIENNGVMYVLNEEANFVKDPAVNDFVSNGGFETVVPEVNFQMVEGASIRMNKDSSGIRFTARVAKAYLDRLTENGASYKLMMQVNRENSSKTAYVECTNSYEDGDYIVYNVAIVNLKASSYTLDYTAKPYIEVTNGSTVEKVFTETISQVRNINDVAYSAYTDISETYDAVKYPYEIMWEGRVQYSPYSASQRDILASYVTDAVLLSDGVYKFVNESSDNFLMLSDNAEVNAFFSEYADRFIYYYKDFEATGNYVTDTVVGNASTSWKDWEAESILFMDSLHLNGNDDQLRGDIENAKVDKYGYVWEGNSFFGQGWNSPTYVGSRATTSDPFLSDGWEFANGRKNSAILAIDGGATGAWGACDVDWAVNGDGAFEGATVDCGVNNTDANGYFLGHAQNSTYITYSLEDSRAQYNGVLQAAHAPFVEIGLEWVLTSGSISEIYLDFRSGNGSYVSLPLSTWATTEIDFTQTKNIVRLYVPVFEHASWTGKITGLRIRITGNFTLFSYLDFVRGAYDTRMIDSNTSFISAGKQHFENTGDLAFLKENINNYRKALMFLTQYMSDNGLINLANLVGHNGSAQGFATSFISTYWDIISLAPNSSYVNALYYKALQNMAYLEEALANNNVQVAAPSVKLTMTGNNLTYAYNATTLRALAENVKSAVSAPLNESAKTGYFKTFTVTVNGETKTAGRFIEGYYGDTQIDFGAVALNLMILESGVATAEQKEQVLNWIASIDDLYEYVFAPKTNTEDVGKQYCWAYAASEYGVSCQNGGAILFVTYYDILARAQVYGAENAFARLEEVMAWFADVKAAFVASGRTNAKEFFLPYYETHNGTLQGRGEEGALGLDAEFVENSILYASVPNVFFGMNTYYDADGVVMQVAPNLPDAIGTWKMEQVRYVGLTYDIAVSNNFVVVCNVEELADGALDRNAKLEVTLSYAGNTPKVYINNKLVTEGYTVDRASKTVTITVDFGNVSIAVQ